MESVFAVATKHLPSFHGFMEADESVIDAIRRHGVFKERKKAENDFSMKQIIPYTTFMIDGKIFVMRRTKKGGEARLHDRMSIGIGGHINHIDDDPINDGLRREFFEEVIYNGTFNPVLLGFINDDSDDVGKVHFGICYLVEGDSEIDVREKDVLEGNMMKPDEIEKDMLEKWSRIVLENLLKSPYLKKLSN